MMDDDLQTRLKEMTRLFLAENAKVNLSAFRTEETCWIGNVLDSLAALDTGVFPSIPQPLPPEEEGGFKRKKPVPRTTLHFAREMRKNPTEAEELLWEQIRYDQLGVRFRRQAPLGGRILDFFCPQLMLAIEVDGGIHTKKSVREDDGMRDTYLQEEHGITTLRFTNEEVFDHSGTVLKTIKQTIQKHSPPPAEEGVGVEEKQEQPTFQIFDVGTGGGFPLLALAICLPNTAVTGLDSTQKKLDAINRVADAMDLQNIQLLYGRAEEVGHDPNHRERYDVVTARALAPLPTLLELCSPFVKVGGHLLCWKSMRIEQELKDSLLARAEMSCQLEGSHEYDLGKDWGKRQILIFRKRAALAQKYPRETGIPKKSPLL